ncbi:coiled-coil domain-containing protein 157-like [Chanos chanos]|uniref:Coiled-coil domain-containing protein 157-like n=1 Tax=Chanos chanos TaxID=29144 RepID=A0A6J2UN60_CHACN|nr:coiled-coil domain-containing protein 157-like [Chanos chanos]
MLLIQSFNTYAELMLGGQRRASRSGQSGVSVSLGPVVKNYWNNLVQLSKQHAQGDACKASFPQNVSYGSRQQIQHNASHEDVSTAKIRVASSAPFIHSQESRSTASVTSSRKSISSSKLDKAALSASSSNFHKSILSAPSPRLHTTDSAAELKSVGCQTAESSSVPCEACGGVQMSFKESSEALVSLCQSLGLPCSLKQLMVTVEDSLQLGHLSACDVAQWTCEQRKDMGRLGKHVLESGRDLKTDRIFELYTLPAIRAEREGDRLRGEVHLEKETCREEEERRQALERELSSTQLLLEKETAKYHSVQRQNELEESEDEKAELTGTLTQTTQERDTLLEQLAQNKSQCSSLHEEGERLRARIDKLEESMCRLKEEIEQAAQRERLLVTFPELNTAHRTSVQSTGDMLQDMEQHLHANTIRIRVLEKENATLSSSLARLRETQRGGDQYCPPQVGSGEQQRFCPPVNAPLGTKHRVSPSAAQCSTGGSTVTKTGPWDQPPMPSPSSSSSSAVLHQQTLCLSLPPDPAQTYTKIRQAARARSAGSRHRRKQP